MKNRLSHVVHNKRHLTPQLPNMKSEKYHGIEKKNYQQLLYVRAVVPAMRGFTEAQTEFTVLAVVWAVSLW